MIFPHGSGFPSVILSDAGRNILWWDDINTNAGLVLRGADGLAFDTVTGISGTATQAKNLRGTATLTGTAKAVNIPIALEPDTNYRVVATASFTGGTPAAGSNRLWVSNKTTGQFTINVEVAPGTGNTVSFDWVLIR